MTRRYRGSKTSVSRRALLPIVGAIPIAVAVTCSIATGHAAAGDGVPAPPPFQQLWTNSVQPEVTPRAVDTPAAPSLSRMQFGIETPVAVFPPGGVPGGDDVVREIYRAIPHADLARAVDPQSPHVSEPVGVGAVGIPVPESVAGTMPGQAKNAATGTETAGGPHPGPFDIHYVDDNYSDRVTQMTVNGGTAGLVIGALVGGVPAAVVGAVPGAIIGGAVGAIAGGLVGGVAMAVPTLGVGAPLGAVGGLLAGAGVGAVIGAVIGGIVAAIPTGIVGAGVGYALGAATGTGNGIQG